MKSLSFGAAATVACLLTACGGGGSSSGDASGDAPPPIALASLQGFWNGSISGANLGSATKARVVVLENGAAWLFLHDGVGASEPLVGLATATLAVSGQGFTGVGKRYPASGNLLVAVTVSGNGPDTGALGITFVDGAAAGSQLNLAYDARYAVAATRADVTGSWRFTKENATIVATWSINESGVLSGTSTLGCTYSGHAVPHAAAAVFDVTVTEACGSNIKQLAGIGKLNADKSFLTFGLTTTDGAQAEAFAAGRV